MARPSGARHAGLLLAGLSFAAGCGGTHWRGTEADPAGVSFAPELQVDLESMQLTPSGLYLLDLQEGTGAAAWRTSLVTVHYATWLPDGSLVDASVGGEPFSFRLGGKEVIRGWNLGIPGMKVGGRRRLVVRPGLGYGSRGTANVPPQSTLLFEIQLLDVR